MPQKDPKKEELQEKPANEYERQYQLLRENMFNGFSYCRMIFDRGVPMDFIFLDVNGSFESLTGLSDVVGKKISDILPGIREADPDMFDIFGRVALTGKSERNEFYVKALKEWLRVSVYCPEREFFIVVFDIVTEHKQVIDEVRLKDGLLSMAGKMAKVGGWEFDALSGHWTWTDEVARIHGFDPDRLTSVDMGLSLYSAESKDVIENSLKNAIETGIPYTHELNLVDAEGENRFVKAAGFPIKENGKVVKVQGIVQDITELKKTENSLKESERLYRSLFENMLNAFVFCKMIYDQGEPVDLIYLDVNKAAEEFTGLKDLAGKKLSEVLPGVEKTDQSVIKRMGRVALSGVPERFDLYLNALDQWFSASLYCPEKEYLVAVFDNITERKLAEEALRASEEMFSKTFRASPMALSIGRASDMKLVEVNDVWCELTGYSKDEAVGFTVEGLKLFPGVQSITIRKPPFEAAMKIEEIDISTKTGEKKRILTSSEFIEMKNDVYEITLSIDITERKRAEKALAESEEKYRLITDNISDVIVTTDMDGNYTFISSSYKRVLGPSLRSWFS